jgi:hypothetical protein
MDEQAKGNSDCDDRTIPSRARNVSRRGESIGRAGTKRPQRFRRVHPHHLPCLVPAARAEQLFLLPSQQLLVPDDALVELLLSSEFSRERLAGDSGDGRTGRVSFDARCAALTSM